MAHDLVADLGFNSGNKFMADFAIFMQNMGRKLWTHMTLHRVISIHLEIKK